MQITVRNKKIKKDNQVFFEASFNENNLSAKIGISNVYDWINAIISIGDVQYQIVKLHLKSSDQKNYNDIFLLEVIRLEKKPARNTI